MKRYLCTPLCFGVALGIFLSEVNPVLAEMSVTKTVTAQPADNDVGFTEGMMPMTVAGTGYLNISVDMGASGTSTVALQRAFQGGAWKDVAYFYTSTEKALEDKERKVRYRLGIKSGNYGSGSIIMRLSN